MTITPLYAGLIGFLYLLLAANVIRGRRANQISLGDGGNATMERRIRAHGNCAEYAPLALVLIAFAEFGGLSATAVHALGIALVVGRVLHATALSMPPPQMLLRVAGMILTLTTIGVAAGVCLGQAIAAL